LKYSAAFVICFGTPRPRKSEQHSYFIRLHFLDQLIVDSDEQQEDDQFECLCHIPDNNQP
jgi:hypothetical protein